MTLACVPSLSLPCDSQFRDALLVAKDGDKELLPQEDVHLIFNHVDVLVDVNTALLQELESILASWHPNAALVGGLFLKMVLFSSSPSSPRLHRIPCDAPSHVAFAHSQVRLAAFVHGLCEQIRQGSACSARPFEPEGRLQDFHPGTPTRAGLRTTLSLICILPSSGLRRRSLEKESST